MGKEKFCCQICRSKFTTVFDFKKHLTSSVHRQNFQEVYQNACFIRDRRSYTPWIFYKDYGFKNTGPILGLSQMTLCFSSEEKNGFYLCHICEQKSQLSSVVNHVSSLNHLNNYFAYTDPNALNFAWMHLSNNSLMDDRIKKEQEKTGIGELQVLHLPVTIQKECDARDYRKVMILLHQNIFLSEMFKENKPNRMKLQTYKDDANRKQPLLGLQHIVECICVSHCETRNYLCTLCGCHVSSSMIIRHLLSFDHIYCYFSKWHPSTLKEKESYKNDKHDFASTFMDFAKQSEELYGLADIQQVVLKPHQVVSVLNACFKEALSKIESFTKKKISLPIVKPGMKLEPTLSGSGKLPTKVKEESNPEPGTSGTSSLPSASEPSASSAAHSYSLHCQNCSQMFETNTLYFNHLLMGEHQEKFIKNFGQAEQCKPQLPLYNFTKLTTSCVGLSLVVTILSHQLGHEHVHVCFACETVFSGVELQQHMDSLRHLVQSLIYQNPWRLPFAWKIGLDHNYMKLQACKEEEERGPAQQIIRILDVPSNLFPGAASLSFSKVMETLDQFHSLLMSGVPQRETFRKLQDNDRFPLLGWDFLVKYGQAAKGWKFLCLLCQRTLSADEYVGHAISWEHVVTFLDKYHPGSLDTINEGILLDLAKQAAGIHCVSKEQEIVFEQHIYEVSDYGTNVRLLSAERARDGKGPLLPCITPKMKLVPRQRQTLGLSLNAKATNESNVVENIQLISEKSSEKTTDGVQSLNQITETNKLIQKEIKTEEQLPNLSAPRAMEEVPALKRSQCLPDMDISDSENDNVDPKRMCSCAPEEREEKPNLQNIDVTVQCRSSDASVVDPVQHGWMLWSHIQKKIREPLIGLSAVYECVCNDHAPVYLCECCRLIFKEQYICRHLSETWHYKNYLERMGENPLPHGKGWKEDMSKLAAYWERNNGYGEAQVVELTLDEYSKLTYTEFEKALSLVKNHLAMQKTNITCGDTTTAKTPQQDVKMEIDLEPVKSPAKTDLSSRTEKNSKSNQEIIMTRPQGPEKTTTITPPCSLTSALTITTASPTICSLSEDDNFKMGDEKPTVTSKQSKPICKFISTRCVITDADSKNPDSTITGEDASLKKEDKTLTATPKPVCKFKTTRYFPETESKTASTSNTLENITSASSTTDIRNPNSKLICKFMTKSANQNMLTPAMTHLAPSSPNGIAISSKSSAENIPISPCDGDDLTPSTQTASSLVEDFTKVTHCPSISNPTVSNATKDAPNPQGPFTIQLQSIPSNVVCKHKANSVMASERSSEVVLSGNNPFSAKKAKTISTEASQTKLQSASLVESTSATMDNQTKSTENQLKLNVIAATHNAKYCSGQKTDSFTPTTPNCDPQTRTTEVSEKPTKTTPKIGLDMLLKVSCKESSHTYCFACSVKLEKSNHLTSTTHQINCVKAKYPWWSSKPNESKLTAMVALIADDQKALKIKCKQIEVHPDVYKELKSLPDDKAIEKAQGMKSAQRRTSAPTSEASISPCDISSSPNFSPFDVTSPDLGKENGQITPQEKSTAEPIKKSSESSPNPTVQKPTSKVAPRIIKGSTTDDLSNLSHILKVMDRTVIGISFVWECRVVPPKLPTFYLCESCCQTISVNEIYEHMSSAEHRRKYIMRQYPKFMYWIEDDLLPEMKEELTNDIAGWVLCREELMDAQTVLLSEECFEWVRTAPFVEALSVVQRIKQEKKTTTLPLIVTSQHVEPRGQHRTQLTLDTSNIPLTDLHNQLEMSKDRTTTDSGHTTHGLDENTAYANAERCLSPTESITSPRITQPLPCSVFNQHMSALPKDGDEELPEQANEATNDIATPLSQINAKILSQIPVSLVSQPPSTNPPEHMPTCSVIENVSASPNNENQEHFEPENKVNADISSILSHNSAVGTPAPIDSIGTTSLTTLKDTSNDTTHETEIKLELQPVHDFCAPEVISQQNDEATSPIKEKHMALEGSPQYSSVSTGETTSVVASSMAEHNESKSPALDPDLQNDVDMFQMLINLIKQNKPPVNLTEPCTTESSESNVQMCQKHDAPRLSRWDVKPPPNTDNEVAPKQDGILTEDMKSTVISRNNSGDSLTSESGESKEKTEKLTAV